MDAPPADPGAAVWPRSFLALAPTAACRARLAALPPVAQSKPTHPDDLHLTLAFIGGISDSQRKHLVDALPALASYAGAIPPLMPRGIEAWPGPERPRVRVAVYDLPDVLQRLVLRVQALLADAGLPVDPRPFRPHITLARFTRGAAMPADGVDATLAYPTELDALSLYCRSEAADGPRYATLAAVALR